MVSEPSAPIRILLLEDSDIDAELVASHLTKADIPFEIVRVLNRREFLTGLANENADIILADYSLPDFDGLSALTIAREATPDIPFVFVSGVVGEEFATNALKRGATDYVMKRNLGRLPVAVDRALTEARERAERRRAEQALRASEISAKLAFEAAELGLWDMNVATGETYWDPRTRALFGLPAEEQPQAERLYAATHPEDVDRVREAIGRAISLEDDGRYYEEFRVVHPGGEVRWLAARGQAFGEDGVPQRFLGVVRDITEEKRNEAGLRSMNEALEALVQERTRAVQARSEELAASNSRLLEQIAERERVEDTLRQMQRLEAVGQLTAGVAHDFNNLLTVILGNVGFVERALDSAGLDGKLKQRIGNMRSAAERGAKLTAQLLAFSRRQRLEPKALDLNDTVASMRDLLQSTMGGSVRLETVLKPDLWPALVDPTQIELIILNLAINARDAMEVGGGLTVETANVTLKAGPRRAEEPGPGDYVMLSVSDTGSGMSEEVLAKAFEPFFTTKEIGKGSGLGLAQVYGFAKQSGGGVRIDTRLGEGTAVKVFLPRAASEAGAEAEIKDPTPTGGDGLKRNVLVLDDDSAVREVTAAMLQELGYGVYEAGSAGQALDLLDRGVAVDLLLADYAMPGMNGVETATEAKRRRPDLPVLFITGYADLAALKDVGEERIVQKPFRDSELAQKVAWAIERSGTGGNVVPLTRKG